MSRPDTRTFLGGGIAAGVILEEARARRIVEELYRTAEIGVHVQTAVYEYEKIIVSLATHCCTQQEGCSG